MLTLIKKWKWTIVATLVFALVVFGLSNFWGHKSTGTQSFTVVQNVQKGQVSSGIETTGQIKAAQKLDLNVYKQMSRIDVVNVQNGSHVEANDVLISFDKSDVSISARSAAVSVAAAELDLEAKREDIGDPNTQINDLKNKIIGLEESIPEAERDFLNENLTIEPANSLTKNKIRPAISGRYTKEANTYRILIGRDIRYDSQFTYKVFNEDGKISEHEVVYGLATPIADTGLKITFTELMNIEDSDKWLISLPNTAVATYAESKTKFEAKIRDIELNIASSKQQLSNLLRGDSVAYRDLDLEKAELSLYEARQRLSENYDSINERDIIAPFAGTVQDMENVVVGATPTGGSADSIHLGTLISDEYLVTFTLDAADVVKIKPGQKVEVAVTSYPNQPNFTATITEISSLPTGTGVAQYNVNAKLDYDAKTSETILREGMLADIVIVQDEKDDVLRVPTSAISYENGRPVVQKVDSLTADQQKQLKELGIVKADGAEIPTYTVEIGIGIQGRFFTEVTSGLADGDMIMTTNTTNSSTNTAVQAEFGAPPTNRGNEGRGGFNRTTN